MRDLDRSLKQQFSSTQLLLFALWLENQSGQYDSASGHVALLHVATKARELSGASKPLAALIESDYSQRES